MNMYIDRQVSYSSTQNKLLPHAIILSFLPSYYLIFALIILLQEAGAEVSCFFLVSLVSLKGAPVSQLADLVLKQSVE